jgi:hypothetical protein
MEEGGLTHITAAFMNYRKLIEENYYDKFEEVLEDVMDQIGKHWGFEVEDRIVRNAAIILTTVYILAPVLGDAIPYNYEQLRFVMIKSIKEQMSLISSSNETNTFWDTVVFLKEKGDIKESEDFAFDTRKTVKVTLGKEDHLREFDHTTELLFIRFGKIIPLYKEAFKRQSGSGQSPMDRSSLQHYLAHSKAFVGLISAFDFKGSRTSCYCFNYEMLKAQGVYLGGSESTGGTPPPPVKVPEAGHSDSVPF